MAITAAMTVIRKKAAQAGCFGAEGLLILLAVAVLIFSGYAMFHYADSQRPAASSVTFHQWYINKPGHERAKAAQIKTQLPMLVYIFASWCPHCKEFNAHVLSQPSVQRFLSQYPHVKVEPEHSDAERQIMDDYKAPGYPSFYVVSPQGDRYQVDTFVSAPEPRAKTPEEFVQSVRETIDAFMRQ
jgi:thiol:disulfide interchange protein